MRTALLVVVALAQVLDARQALELGRTRDGALFASFNRGYELAPGDTINRAEIITEFRRAVLIVRDHANKADYAFSEHELARAMTPFEGLVTFVVEARLHPLHTYVKAPAYTLYVETGPATKPLAPEPFVRDAVLPFGMIGPGNPVIGVRLEGTFARAAIESASAPTLVVLDEQADVVWKTRIELGRYR